MNAAKIRFAHKAITSIAGGLIDGERSFVVLVREENRGPASVGAQRLMRGIEQCAAHSAADELGMHKQ